MHGPHPLLCSGDSLSVCALKELELSPSPRRCGCSPGCCLLAPGWGRHTWVPPITWQGRTLVVFTLLPLLQLHPERSGSTLHSSPSRHGSIWHHHFCSTMEAGERRGSAARLQHRAWRTSSAHLWVTPADTAPPSSTAHTEEPWTRSCSSPAWPHLLHLPPEHPAFSHYLRKKKARCPHSQGEQCCSRTCFRLHLQSKGIVSYHSALLGSCDSWLQSGQPEWSLLYLGTI